MWFNARTKHLCRNLCVLGQKLLGAARSGQCCLLSVALTLIYLCFLRGGNVCILLLRFGRSSGFLAWRSASCCVELNYYGFSSSLLVGLSVEIWGFSGGWFQWEVGAVFWWKELPKLQLLQMTHGSQLIRSTVVLLHLIIYVCSRLIFIREANSKAIIIH